MRRPTNLLLSTILLFIFSFPATAQVYIGKNKPDLLNELKDKNGPGNSRVTENSTSITFEYADKKSCLVKTSIKFDQDDKANRQEFISSDDSCFNQILQGVLDEKKYEWKKINENQYISGFNHYMMIELPVEKGDFSFFLFKAAWNKETYKILTGN